MRVVFVHGACVRDGDWWWHRTAAPLAAAGVTSVCPPLPSCGETGGTPGHDGPGFDDDVAAVRAVLAAGDEPTVVVGHSYGGMVVAEAAAGVPSVRHLVAISSYLARPGEALGDFGPSEPAPFLVVDPDAGTFAVSGDDLVETFLHDCPDDAGDAFDHLAAQSLSVVGHPVTVSAWEGLPSTYLVCTEDRGTPVAAQRRFAERATHVVDLATGHHPFLAAPDVVAEVLLGLR